MIMNKLKTVSVICLIVMCLLSACSRESEIEVFETDILAGDVTLYARIAGNPAADNLLIGIHGGPGNSSEYLKSLDALVNEEVAVVIYDQRGSGRSSEPSGGYGLLKYVEDLEAVRAAAGSEKVHLFGHSWGGIVAMRYATVHPDKVKSIILFGSGPPCADALNAAQSKLGHRIVELQQQGIVDLASPSTSEELLLAILPAYFSDPEFKMPDELLEMSFNQQVSDLTLAALGEWDFRHEVSQLEIPVLMLWGEDDPFGTEMAESSLAALTSSEVDFILLDNCGHYWQECPQDFYAEVRSFLEKVSQP
jgi:proline iminopeptidase